MANQLCASDAQLPQSGPMHRRENSLLRNSSYTNICMPAYAVRAVCTTERTRVRGLLFSLSLYEVLVPRTMELLVLVHSIASTRYEVTHLPSPQADMCRGQQATSKMVFGPQDNGTEYILLVCIITIYTGKGLFFLVRVCKSFLGGWAPSTDVLAIDLRTSTLGWVVGHTHCETHCFPRLKGRDISECASAVHVNCFCGHNEKRYTKRAFVAHAFNQHRRRHRPDDAPDIPRRLRFQRDDWL